LRIFTTSGIKCYCYIHRYKRKQIHLLLQSSSLYIFFLSATYTDRYTKILKLYSGEDMAINEDVENCVQEEMRQPLMQDQKNLANGQEGSSQGSNKGHPWMVYFSTFVAVCGSYSFGSCVSALSAKDN
jgi:hypothetical protein